MFKLVEDRLWAPPPALAFCSRDLLLFFGEAAPVSFEGEAPDWSLDGFLFSRVPVIPALFPLEPIGFVTVGFFNPPPIPLPMPLPMPLPIPLRKPPPIPLPSIADYVRFCYIDLAAVGN